MPRFLGYHWSVMAHPVTLEIEVGKIPHSGPVSEHLAKHLRSEIPRGSERAAQQ